MQISDLDGSQLGTIRLPEAAGNLCFGGSNHDRLYIAASTSLFRMTLNTQGI